MNDTPVKKSALIVATLASFLTPFVGSSINIALPSIGEEFQIGTVLLGWVATSYLLAAVVCLIPFGRLADIYGRKKIFATGIVIFTVGSFFSAISFSAPMLIFSRIIQGIGSAMIFATGIAILTSVFSPWEIGKVLGINVAAVYIGLTLGPFLGGFLTQYLTWRSVFLVPVPLGLIVISLTVWKLKGEWADAKGESFDFTGSIIYSFSLIMIMYGISLLPAMGSIWLFLGGVLGILSFVKWELKVENPVFEIKLFKTNRVFALSNLAALINYSATFAVTFLLSLYLQYIKELSPQSAGVVLISSPVVMAICSPYAGRLSDRIEPQIVASSGMILTTLGLFLFTFLNRNSTLEFIIANLILLGLGLALFSSPNTNAIMSCVEKKFYGIASGSVGTMRLLGMMISMGIVTLIFTIFLGKAQITVQYHPIFMKGLKVSFTLFSILCFGGIFASLIRGKLRTKIPKKTTGESKNLSIQDKRSSFSK